MGLRSKSWKEFIRSGRAAEGNSGFYRGWRQRAEPRYGLAAAIGYWHVPDPALPRHEGRNRACVPGDVHDPAKRRIDLLLCPLPRLATLKVAKPRVHGAPGGQLVLKHSTVAPRAGRLHGPARMPNRELCDNSRVAAGTDACGSGTADMRRRGRSSVLLKNFLSIIAATLAAICGFVSAARAQAPAQPMRLTVDLREAPRRIFHARLTMPVRLPGALTLLYHPKWIPGEHAPDGPIVDLVSLKFTAGGKTLAWQRDDVDSFRVSPAGARRRGFAGGQLRLPLAAFRARLLGRPFGRSGNCRAGVESGGAVSGRATPSGRAELRGQRVAAAGRDGNMLRALPDCSACSRARRSTSRRCR